MIEGVEEIRDLDGMDLMGFLLYGDVDLLDVELFMADEEFTDAFLDRTPEYGFEITECWVRKVPITSGENEGCMRYVYADAPGPGARKAVRIEEASFWGHWCMFHIYEPASTGYPLARVPDVIWPMVHVRISDPNARWRRAQGPHDGEATVYLCRACSNELSAREERARWEHMRAYYTEQGNDAMVARYDEKLAAS